MATVSVNSSLEGLPKQFVSSLRVLFDILDEDKKGVVRFVDIENRWQGDEAGLPSGVLVLLKKVVPADGTLTFERFVTGLKMALVTDRPNHDKTKSTVMPSHRNDIGGISDRMLMSGDSHSVRPSLHQHSTHRDMVSHSMPTSPIRQTGRRDQNLFTSKNQDRIETSQNPRDQEQGQGFSQSLRPFTSASALQKSNVPSMPQHKTHSMPHLLQSNEENGPDNPSARGESHGSQTDKKNINEALKKWQQERLGVRQPIFENRWPGDGRASIASTSALDRYGAGEAALAKPFADDNRRTARRRDSRRHTVSNGVDSHMLKRMKQLEQEKTVLLGGMDALERARDWYQRQVVAVQNKQRVLGQSPAEHENTLEAHQERINFLGVRIAEVNQQLAALVESSVKGFPVHINLAVTSPSKRHNPDVLLERENTISMLKAQNKMLTEEVSRKSNRISTLEQEKTQLIREMFQASSKHRDPRYDDTTFI